VDAAIIAVMKLRHLRSTRSAKQGALTRSAVWMPVGFSSTGFMTLRKVRLDMLPPPAPMHGQSYVVFEDFIAQPAALTVGPATFRDGGQ